MMEQVYQELWNLSQAKLDGRRYHESKSENLDPRRIDVGILICSYFGASDGWKRRRGYNVSWSCWITSLAMGLQSSVLKIDETVIKLNQEQGLVYKQAPVPVCIDTILKNKIIQKLVWKKLGEWVEFENDIEEEIYDESRDKKNYKNKPFYALETVINPNYIVPKRLEEKGRKIFEEVK